MCKGKIGLIPFHYFINSEIQPARMASVRRFKFDTSDLHEKNQKSLIISIPEVLDPSYGMYVWPSAVVLAQYVSIHREEIKSKRILEVGAGTSLPGVVAAKLGASVTLTDDIHQPVCLENCKKSCQENQLEDVSIMGLSWGRFTPQMLELPPQDIILASDCFYDSKDFEDIVATFKFFIQRNNKCQCWVTYQQRSTERSIEYLLQKWKLKCCHVPLVLFGADSPCIAGSELPGNHTIEMMIITDQS
ncbi:Methyltransferase-like protein 23 [Holothuria leucospilota]|uniref:Methyltransferase-like protein 23 n=1 Tax=Holothuria leucospilota TaxID=206669 RepID=A0A9Q1C3F9_HOLLE|nr:Methyltransferase-like protein 23 [Holothuria leucospilota]